jgi:aquaporin Z
MSNISSPIKYLVEFLGTFFFLYIILIVVKKNSGFGTYSPIVIGLALMLAIGFGGGHFNPVVSLIFAIHDVFSWSDVIPYTCSQILGGVAAKYMFDLVHS